MIPAMVLIRPRERGKLWTKDGDVLYGEEYFAEPPKECYKDKPFIPLAYESWNRLRSLGIDVEPFRSKLVYECPWTNNKYFWFMPAVLFTDNPKDWLKTAGLPDYMVGVRWGEDVWKKFELGKVLRSMVGHGYTDGTLPDDGSGYLEDAIVHTTVPGTWLGGQVWVWYNK